MTTQTQIIEKQEKKTFLVTTEQLNSKLSEFIILNTASCFAHVVQLTTPKCTKKDRQTLEPFNGHIQKLSKVSIILNSEFGKRVLNQLGKENKPPQDYKQGRNTMPIEKCDNNNFYGTFNGKGVITYEPNPNKNLHSKVKYFLNGKPINKENLPDVLPKKYAPKNQGTANFINWRKLYTENIKQIILGKNTYVIVD